jgi:hypothetical protein
MVLLPNFCERRKATSTTNNRFACQPVQAVLHGSAAKRIKTMLNHLKHLLTLASLFSFTNSCVLGPGIGLCSKNASVEIVIFEHTENGTGGLVLNCAAPLKIGSLNIPRFQAFKELPLMLGNGMSYDDDG